MEQGNKKIVFVAIVLAIITSAIIFSYLKKIELANKSIEYVNIPVAAKAIQPRTVITEQDLKEIRIEKSLVIPGAMVAKSDIVNKTTKEAIYEGEQILATRIADKNNTSLAFQIPKGKRAITINVNEASVIGYFVSPGDYVDVIATLQKDSQGNVDMPVITKTLLQKVLVLGVAQQRNPIDAVENKVEKKDAKNATSSDNNVTKTITLAVSPEEAERVTLSEEKGILKLTLRPVGDENTITSTGIVRNDLLR